MSNNSDFKVKVKVDDWGFIKIIFSNHPDPHPESFEKAIYSYPKLKVLVYVRGF